MRTYKSVNEYISSAPKTLQKGLREMRAAIKSAAPKATEAIKYGIPTFVLNRKNLVHFAAFKDHYSFFPTSSPIPVFKEELAKYQLSKGTIRLPTDKPLPVALIKKITRFRVKEVIGKPIITKH